MPTENVPTPSSPESPPMGPHDPPEPAPQAIAWRRALKVVGCTLGHHSRVAKITIRRRK